MAWIKMIPPAEATGELADVYKAIQGAAGDVANILTVEGLNPAALRAHYNFYKVIMFGSSDLSRAQREMVAVVVSTANHCHY